MWSLIKAIAKAVIPTIADVLLPRKEGPRLLTREERRLLEIQAKRRRLGL